MSPVNFKTECPTAECYGRLRARDRMHKVDEGPGPVEGFQTVGSSTDWMNRRDQPRGK